jgi:hypothetical protein
MALLRLRLRQRYAMPRRPILIAHRATVSNASEMPVQGQLRGRCETEQ